MSRLVLQGTKRRRFDRRREDRPRVLYVCFADSTHAQDWIDLLTGSEFDVRVCASPVDHGPLFPPQPWRFPTYVLEQPRATRSGARAIWLLPSRLGLSRPTQFVARRLPLWTHWLRLILRAWRPHIIHTLRLNPEAWLTWQALRGLPRELRPRWVLSSWGSDLNVEIDDPAIHEQMQVCLGECDGFLADCRRDLRTARELGLAAHKVAIEDAVPVTGGLSLADVPPPKPGPERKLIVVPKAYEGLYNKSLAILEALALAEEALDGYEIHLLRCSGEVRRWLRRMPESIQRRCHPRDSVPRSDLFALLEHARVMMAPSLSDGTPLAMLEAMAAGALPLMSPLESIREWIMDGHNGLLAPALHPDRIATALRRALTDDALLYRAQPVNRQLISERANRDLIRPRIRRYYRELASHNAPV